MRRRGSRKRSILREVAILIAIPLALMATGYAIFTQKLTVNGQGTGISYTSTQNLSAKYTRTVTQAGSNWNYTLVFTVKNNGTSTIGSWRVGFTLPTGSTSLVCTSAVCAQAGMNVTADNTTGNGTLNPGGQTTFTVTFTAPIGTAILQNITVSGFYANVYQAIPGLTMTATAGTRTKSGKWYYWPYTFVVTNNASINVSAWRITANWSRTTNVVQSMATTVNYTTTATQLTITSKTAVAKNTTFQFTGSLGSTNQAWALTNYVIEGMP